MQRVNSTSSKTKLEKEKYITSIVNSIEETTGENDPTDMYRNRGTNAIRRQKETFWWQCSGQSFDRNKAHTQPELHFSQSSGIYIYIYSKYEVTKLSQIKPNFTIM